MGLKRGGLFIIKQTRMILKNFFTKKRLRKQQNRVRMKGFTRGVTSTIRSNSLFIVNFCNGPKHFKGININGRNVLNLKVFRPTVTQLRVRQTRFPTTNQINNTELGPSFLLFITRQGPVLRRSGSEARRRTLRL